MFFVLNFLKNLCFTTHILLDANVTCILVLPHMKQAGVSSYYQPLLYVLAVSALFVSFSIFPIKASALEISAQTQQVLPPGANTCAALSVTDFTPYIYNGSLDSFEFTVPDSSYVAVIGSVGNTLVPFELMTRNVDASGNLRVHVDVASTPVSGNLPLEVTMLSAATGKPVCMTVVSMNIGSGSVSNTVPIANPQPTSSTPVTVASSPVGTGSIVTSVHATTSVTQGATSAPVVSTAQNPLHGICGSQASAYRLWLILLVLFTLIIGADLWAEFPMDVAWARTPERIATIILVLLLILLGFWYFSASCRAALWMPLLAFLIAVLGLLAAFWNHPRMTQLLLMQDSSNL